MGLLLFILPYFIDLRNCTDCDLFNGGKEVVIKECNRTCCNYCPVYKKRALFRYSFRGLLFLTYLVCGYPLAEDRVVILYKVLLNARCDPELLYSSDSV